MISPQVAAPANRRPRRRVRQIALIAHLVSSLGWLGLDIVLLVLGAHAAAAPADRYASYLVIQVLLDTLALPLSLSAIATGFLLMRVGPWSFRRDSWATAKTVISTVAVPMVWFALRPRAAEAVAATAPRGDSGALFASLYSPGPTLIIAPSVAFVLYLTVAALGVFKPGRRRSR
ncbi:hypothetical protein [Amycolatopsis taiwanensis]|uniref:DUF2269 domain-containing protein n=1 Tax=Amycolatopsis taiwanensis TaxID=342230 RepID=A0A9W6QZ94_9PSEU|nr:hypothetical protein [Amycolatopsis taiwanensis]GLY66438.1 hypothetical protein Atai01_30570 [Amycolatopsis taiwanensis]